MADDETVTDDQTPDEDDDQTDQTGRADDESNGDASDDSPSKKAAGRRSPAKKAVKKAPAKKAPAKKAVKREAPRAEAPRRPGAGRIAREAAVQLHELIGHEIEGITAVHRDGDGWVVEIDMLELRRIPATTDVLATYEVEMDEDGDLMGYRRRHRFVRGSVSEGG
ncbi:gas vesicle protein GvpO [Nocardioides sp. AN3]